jgi:predicted outer membrane repeat protein
VLIQAFNFVAAAIAITYCDAIPHFVEIEIENLGIDPTKIERCPSEISRNNGELTKNVATEKCIKALVIMHTFGHPSKIEDLIKVAKRFNLVLVEDAADSICSYYDKKHTGTMGLLDTLSFNGNKTITTDGGGAILTNSFKLDKQAKHISTTAKIFHEWVFRHDVIGYNYRMPNINAALGCTLLEHLPNKLEKKRKLFDKYRSELTIIKGISIFEEPKNCTSNYCLQALILVSPILSIRGNILDKLNAVGYMSRPGWDLLNSLDLFIMCTSMCLDVSNLLLQSIINIPSSPNLVN